MLVAERAESDRLRQIIRELQRVSTSAIPDGNRQVIHLKIAGTCSNESGRLS